MSDMNMRTSILWLIIGSTLIIFGLHNLTHNPAQTLLLGMILLPLYATVLFIFDCWLDNRKTAKWLSAPPSEGPSRMTALRSDRLAGVVGKVRYIRTFMRWTVAIFCFYWALRTFVLWRFEWPSEWSALARAVILYLSAVPAGGLTLLAALREQERPW